MSRLSRGCKKKVEWSEKEVKFDKRGKCNEMNDEVDECYWRMFDKKSRPTAVMT